MVRFVVSAVLLSSGLLAATPQGQSSEQSPDTLRSDPATGELIPAQAAPAVTTPPTVDTTRLTEQSIIALARADARRHHDVLALGFGLLGAGAMLTGGIVGGTYTFSIFGFMAGVAVGALPVPALLSSFRVSVPESPQLENAAPGKRESYRQTFISESRRLRRITVVRTELVVGAITGVWGTFVVLRLF